MQTITDTDTAALLLNTDLMGVLERLMGQTWTGAALAKDLGVGIGSVHYRLQKLLEHNLVQVTHEEKRAGRAIKHYTASSDAFFVPYALTNFETLYTFWLAILEPKHLAFVENLVKNAERRATDPQKWGVGLRHISGMGLYLQALPKPPQTTLDPVSWFGEEDLMLSHEQAQAFKLELKALIEKYQLEPGTNAYVMQAGLVWVQE
jgi:predicted transcriptional regulator